jgi:hypothetical protein
LGKDYEFENSLGYRARPRLKKPKQQENSKLPLQFLQNSQLFKK